MRNSTCPFLYSQHSELVLQTDSIPFPTIDDFRADSAFDPNPHKLDLPEDLFETSLLVQSLAVWGPSVQKLSQLRKSWITTDSYAER